MTSQISPPLHRLPLRVSDRAVGLSLVALTMLPSCFLFGGVGSRSSSVDPASRDTAEGYREHLASNPDSPDNADYRARLAWLDLVTTRTALRPVFTPETAFATAPGARLMATVDTSLVVPRPVMR